MKIGGIVEQKQLTLYSIVSLKDKPGSVANVLSAFTVENINLFYITESSTNDGGAVLAFCVDCDDTGKVDRLINTEMELYADSIIKRENMALIGVYGPHFREKPSIAVTFFRVLGQADINIFGISSSISTISCIVDVQQLDHSREVLLEHFELP